MHNSTRLILAIILIVFAGALNCLAQESWDHRYPIAKIKTRSDKEITLTNVSVYADGEHSHYYRNIHQEVEFISFKHRTNLGEEFEGKSESITLYNGNKPIYFKAISFAANGAVETIIFQNHLDVSNKDVILTFPGEDYGIDEWIFYGQVKENGKTAEVNIRGSKIRTITFEGTPPKQQRDK